MLCPQCRAALDGAEPFRVRPVPEPPGLPAVHAAARYADEVRATLLAHKERGALALARPLGAALAGAVRAGLGEVGWGEGRAPGPPEISCSSPSPPPGPRCGRVGMIRLGGSRWRRPVSCGGRGSPARVAAVLRQRRAVADQSGLGSRQRLDNLVGALTVVPGGARVLGGGPVVLVDDVVTTGASLAEAARAVRAVRVAAAAQWAGEGQSGRCEEEAKGALCGEGATAGYVGRTREDSKKLSRLSGAEVTGVDGVSRAPDDAGGVGDVLCAAVVAASPDSFEINRN